jgi:hypothetical protein
VNYTLHQQKALTTSERRTTFFGGKISGTLVSMNEFVLIQTAKFILVVMKVMHVYGDGVDKVDQLLTHNVCHTACHHIIVLQASGFLTFLS